jgi:hypothetical protein
MNDWAERDRALGAMATSGQTEVREDDKWLAKLAALHCELRREGKQPRVYFGPTSGIRPGASCA